MLGARFLISVKVSKGRLKLTTDLGQITVETEDLFQVDPKIETHS